jgi:hypothetical protein
LLPFGPLGFINNAPNNTCFSPNGLQQEDIALQQKVAQFFGHPFGFGAGISAGIGLGKGLDLLEVRPHK